MAGFRILQLLPGIGPSTAAKILDKIAAERKVIDVLKRFAVPKQTAEDWPAFVRPDWPIAQGSRIGLPNLSRCELGMSRICIGCMMMPNARSADIAQLQQIAAGYRSRERFLTELTLEPPEATSGHARATSARRGLHDFIDNPFGQRWGMENRARFECCGRLHPLGQGDQDLGRD